MNETKLYAKAEFLKANVPGLGDYSAGLDKSTVVKFQFEKNWYKLVEAAQHFYRTDPIVSNTIDKFVDISMKGYYLARGDCTDEEYLVYSSVNKLMLQNLQELALEYYLSGLIVPEVAWHSAGDLHPDLSKPYIVPETLWKRNPLSLELKQTPIPNRVNVYAIPSDEDILFIQQKGVYSDGTKDKETYELLKREYPEFVRAVQKGEVRFKLEDPHLIRRKPLDDSPYPTLYLLPAFEPLEHKRNLRKMDYAIAARVIAAILLFRMGSDEFPLTEDDDDQVLALKSQLTWRGLVAEPERLFQLFANHTLQIDWITPDVAALLDDKKYDAVNMDILLALGIPRIVLMGEVARTGTSHPEFALLSIAEALEALRDTLSSWSTRVYKEMKDRNGFINLPIPTFEAIRLADLAKIIEIADILYQRGAIAKSTLARLGGFDYENVELPMRVEETERLKSLDLDEFPLMPYTATPPTQGADNNPTKPNEGNNG
jgi:hypothetical protein